MKIKISTNLILKFMQVISWIIFIGLCVDAGGLLVNFIIAQFINPKAVDNFWVAKEYLSALHEYNQAHFVIIVSFMSIIAILKAILFYFIVQLFTEKKWDIEKPFNTALRKFLSYMVFITFGISLFSYIGKGSCYWLASQGFIKEDLLSLNLTGADVWLFMSGIILVILLIVKRGIEIQQENNLTI